MLALLLVAFAAPLPSPPDAGPARMEGFLRLWVDPQAFADGVRPIAPSPSGAPEDLRVENPTSARAVVRVGEVEVGELAPFAIGWIRSVSPGTYATAQTVQDGWVRRAEIPTVPAAEP